jgi:hypothetical protein
MLTACSPSNQTTPLTISTITPIAGWHKISDGDFEVWLPENYIGGTKNDLDIITQEIAELGPGYANMAEIIKANKGRISAFAVDKDKGDLGFITNVVLTQEVISENITIENYVDSIVERLPEQYKVVSKNTLPSTTYPTGLLVMESSVPQLGALSQATYALKNGGAFWQITFTSHSTEFKERLPVFEQIVRSIRVPFIQEKTSRQGDPVIFSIGIGLMIIAMLLSVWQKRQKRKKKEAM